MAKDFFRRGRVLEGLSEEHTWKQFSRVKISALQNAAASFARCVLEASARMLSRAHGPVACDGPDLFLKRTHSRSSVS